MHCLHYIDVLRLELGGVVRAVLDLTGMLANSGAQVTLMTGDDTDAPPPWREGAAGVPRVVRIDRARSLFGGTPAARRTLDTEIANADVVHLHTPWDPFNPVIAAATRRGGKPYVLSVHGMLDDWVMAQKRAKKQAYLALIGNRLLRQARRLHFTAAGERDQSMRRVRGEHDHVLPLLLDLEQYREAPSPGAAHQAFPEAFAGEGPTALFVGRLHPIKGLDRLVEALGRLSPSQRPNRLVFAGPYEAAYREELQRIAERSGIKDLPVFLGMVHGEQKRSLYAACDLFVLPSHHENFGIALVEAMCSGAPVLTNRSVNIWPEVERFGGVIVDDQVDSLAQGLRRAMRDLGSLQSVARANREAVLDWLDPQKLSGDYLAMYEAVVREAAA